MPAPKDPAHLTELTTLGSKLTAAYGSGKYCKDPNDKSSCRNLDELSKVLADDRDWDHDLEAWAGWHQVGRGMLKDYQRFVELLNEGARDLGYDNVGTMWRAGYDMSPADFEKETDRLWTQVQPLYGAAAVLHARQARDEVRRAHAQGRHDPRAHHRQHVGAELGESLSDAGAVSRRRQPRREPAPRSAAQGELRRIAQGLQGQDADADRSRRARTSMRIFDSAGDDDRAARRISTRRSASRRCRHRSTKNRCCCARAIATRSATRARGR